MTLPKPLSNIKAEAFLSSFITDESHLDINTQGIFSRNYNDDIIEMEWYAPNSQTITVNLSRDSVFHILPENLFFDEHVLKELAKQKNEEKLKAEEERIRKEKQKICLFYKPFDATYFKLLFRLEKEVNDISTSRSRLLLDRFFDVYDLDSDNPLIQQTIPLIPIASEIRGNKKVMKDILRCLYFPAPVDLYTERKRHATGITQNMLRVIIHIERLSLTEFKTLQNNTNDFARFFYEWFLPVDMGYEFKIKDTKQRFVLGGAMTLDYNTYLIDN